MKKLIKPFLSIIVLFSLVSMVSLKAPAQGTISLQVFYDELSPYGQWIDNPEYGYVWLPDVQEDFAPYSTNGYWVFTDAGWTWLSAYQWGWAPFHYGRWYHDPEYGYAWIPGNEWGPGWVTWRSSKGYYGWAPIGPGIGIDFAYSNWYNQPYNEWRFVQDRDFGRTNISNYYVTNIYYTTIINNSTVINNMYDDRAANVRYNTGPERTEVQRHTGNRINPVSLRQTDHPSQSLSRKEYRLYRPDVERNNNDKRKPVPQQVTAWNNGRPEIQNERTARKQENNQRDSQRTQYYRRVQPVRNNQPVRTQPVQTPQKDRTGNQPPVKPFRRDQPVREQPVQSPRKEQPRKEERPVQQPRKDQPVREQPAPPQREQPVKQQPAPSPRREAPVPPQPVRKDQPVKQAPQQKGIPVKGERTAREFNDRPESQWPDLPAAVQPPAQHKKTKLPFLQPIPFTPNSNPSQANRKAAARVHPVHETLKSA